jgi:hypothetical protein
MYYEQVEKINADIERTGRAIIALGCSFVQGQGAVNDELYVDYDWHFERIGIPLSIKATPEQKQEIASRYPNVKHSAHGVDFTMMEYDNAFCNVLASKYFEGSYAAINLGIRGCGNRGTIKELYFHPEIHWDKIRDMVVIYCPSGLERFDFVNDGWGGHHHWTCMWPHYRDVESGPRKLLFEGYNKRLHSEKFEAIEQIGHVQELLTWCKSKNARLIITSAFDRRYTREHFHEVIDLRVSRKFSGEVTEKYKPESRISDQLSDENDRLLELFPWDNIFLPDGKPTFADLGMAQEFPDWEHRHFFIYNGISSPEKWITPCAHPSAKCHDLFAKILFEHISNS